MPINHYPTGVTYSDAVLSRIAAKASAKQVPIIENDAYGELSHGGPHASTLKKFDPNDFVLQMGSFAQTLGSPYGLGWVISHRFREKLLEQQFFNDPVAGDAVMQRAVAQYILRRSYDRHLRRMRKQLEIRMRRGLTQIAQLFPPQCAVSRPAGGFTCSTESTGLPARPTFLCDKLLPKFCRPEPFTPLDQREGNRIPPPI